MRTRIEVDIKFPIRNSRNVPNKQSRIYRGKTESEAKAELQELVAAGAYEYGEVKGVRVYDAEAFNAEPLKTQPLRTYGSLTEYLG